MAMKLGSLLPSEALVAQHLMTNLSSSIPLRVTQCRLSPQSQQFHTLQHQSHRFRAATLPRRPSTLHHLRHARISTQASLQGAIHILTDTPGRDVAAVVGSVIGARMLVTSCELLEEWGIVDKVRAVGPLIWKPIYLTYKPRQPLPNHSVDTTCYLISTVYHALQEFLL